MAAQLKDGQAALAKLEAEIVALQARVAALPPGEDWQPVVDGVNAAAATLATVLPVPTPTV